MAISRLFPSLLTRSGQASKVPGESCPIRITSCRGGDASGGIMCIVRYEECIGFPVLLLDSFGDVKSNLSLFGPSTAPISITSRSITSV